MAFESYDPREPIRETIGTSKYSFAEKKTVYCICITDSDNEDINIPMYLDEETNTEVLPEMPFIEMFLAHAPYEVHNPAGTIREMRAHIDNTIHFTNTDNITPKDFMKKIKDALQDVTRTNQSDVAGTWFFTITDERPQKYVEGKRVEFACVVTMECIWTDAC